MKSAVNIHPTHLICCDFISDKAKEEAIIRLAEWIIKNGIGAHGYCRVGRDLLLRKHPRITGDALSFDSAQEQAIEWVKKLENGILPIQGPPGTGKSHTAAKMILSLVKGGKKIGVAALSHKVITALLEKVIAASQEENFDIRIVQKVREVSKDDDPNWTEVEKNPQVL